MPDGNSTTTPARPAIGQKIVFSFWTARPPARPLLCMELRAYLSYRRKKQPLTYWRSKSGHFEPKVEKCHRFGKIAIQLKKAVSTRHFFVFKL
jgi:hypothetical protein